MPFGLGFFATAGVSASAGSFDLLETQVLGSSAASVVFSNLNTNYASTYKHLQIRAVARSNRSASTNDSLMGRLNADTGSNYSRHNLRGNGSTVTSSGNASQTSFYFGDFTASNATANTFGAFVIDLLDAFETTKYTTYRCLSGSVANDNDVRLSSGAWLNTNAVSSITLLANGGDLVQYSRFSLYGIKGA